MKGTLMAGMRRLGGWTLGLLLALAVAPAAVRAQAPEPQPRKVLHVAFSSAETGFDPAQISDLYSRTVTPHIFEAPYRYDHLARPIKIKLLTAAAMPEVSDDFKTWTVKLRPGIYFASDPAFKGVRRELVAQDYVYAFQRTADPLQKSQLWTWVETFKIVGLADYRRSVVAAKKKFDYDHEIAGLRALDRHTLRVTLAEPNPRFLEVFCASDLLGGIAREVVDFYGDAIAEHPVGTGPFKLKQWRRSSLIVLERNPEFREMVYDAEPAADDAEGQAAAAKLKGRRLPMVDEVQISIIQEDQPRWLSFVNGQLDAIAGLTGAVPPTFIGTAMPNGKVAPNLAKRGIQARQVVNAALTLVYFNMEDPVVGGYTPEKIALRRAIGMAMDIPREIRLIRRGQATPARSQVVPHTSGYDPDFRTDATDYDPARAKALLDVYGYVDRDGDGWRELPDGKPLVVVRATQPEQISRQFDELWRKNLQAIGIRTTFVTAQWAEQLKQARAGKLMVWSLGSSAAGSDGQDSLARLHGPQSGSQNLARFKLPEFDAIYDRMSQLPDGPERDEMFKRLKRLALAYMPYRPTVHSIGTDMWYPWVVGFKRPVFWNEWWHVVDIDTTQLPPH